MFLMQLCSNARHLEVQIVGDKHGQAVALNGRDCSTQRRFQKIFEEAPAAIADPGVFREMELAAMRLTQSIGYSGAGTVEYLYHAATKKYYSASRGAAVPSRHRGDSCPSDEVVGGFFFDFGAVRTASSVSVVIVCINAGTTSWN